MQNIAEGSQASGTSKKTELKPTNVARASLEELRLDYEDFLRQRQLSQWARNDWRREELIARRPATADDVARWARDVRGGAGGGQSGLSGQAGQGGQEKEVPGSVQPASSTQSTQSTPSTPSTSSTQSTSSTYAEISANGALALVAVSCALLDRQIASLEKAFVEEGGFTERLYRVRSARRDLKPPSGPREGWRR